MSSFQAPAFLLSVDNLIPTFISMCLASSMAALFIFYRHAQLPKNVPPSPFVLPLLGNILSLAGKDIFETFRKLRRKHGDVFSVYVGQELMIVLNGYDSIHDALVKNGTTFMCRPNKAFNRLVIRNPGIVYADLHTWKEQKYFALDAIKKFGYTTIAGMTLEDKIKLEVNFLIEELHSACNSAIDLKDMFSTSAANIVSQIIFGRRFDFGDETFSEILDNMNEITRLAAKANSILNSFPWMIHLPGDPLKIKRMRSLIDDGSDFYKDLYRERCKTYTKDTNNDFMGLYIEQIRKNEKQEKREKNSFTPERLLSIQRELLTGGGDTVSTALLWTILYLVKYPDVQKSIQADIDAVVCTDRKPCLADREQLPFIEATIMETLRISKILPFAVPHSVLTDTQFRGYTIPQNSTVLINLESVLMDSSVWENPTEFRPCRFIDSSGRLIKPKEFIPFSLGRRSCVGETLAVKELFLYVTCLLHELEFVLPDGAESPSTFGTIGFTYSPKPFIVNVKKRR